MYCCVPATCLLLLPLLLLLVPTFKVCHELCCAAVECVDYHLAVHRACDLHAAVDHPGGRRGPLPRGIIADVGCLGQEVCM